MQLQEDLREISGLTHADQSPGATGCSSPIPLCEDPEDEVEPGELVCSFPLKNWCTCYLCCDDGHGSTYFPISSRYGCNCFRCLHGCVNKSHKSSKHSNNINDDLPNNKILVGETSDDLHLNISENCLSRQKITENKIASESLHSTSHKLVSSEKNFGTVNNFYTIKAHVHNYKQIIAQKSSNTDIILMVKRNSRGHSVNFPLLRLPAAERGYVSVHPKQTSSFEDTWKQHLGSWDALVLPLGRSIEAQQCLPPDDKLLALPLLKLPHEVQQPRNHTDGHTPVFVKDKENYSPHTVLKKHFDKKLQKKDNILFFTEEGQTFSPAFGNKCTNVNSKLLPHDCCPASDKRSLRAEVSSEPRMDGIEVVKKIGHGSYGSIWLVRRSSNKKNLVLKCVELVHCNQQEVEAARQEVLLLSVLKHPNIVSYKGSFELDCRLHLLMAYCEGGDLSTRIKLQHGSLFPEQKIIRWFIQITMALQYLHVHNVLHRDLKSQNIFLTRSGLIKLGDFGIARILNSSVDMATTMIGTPSYMSPELFAGLPYNYKSDIWALGCLLYELATLKHPFPVRDMSSLIYRIYSGKVERISSHYSKDLQYLVRSLMTCNVEHRPNTSWILHQPFIRRHILVFLNDTTNLASACGKNEKQNAVAGDKKRVDKFEGVKCVTKQDSRKNYSHYPDRKVFDIKRETLHDNGKQSKPVMYHYNLHSKRCSGFLQTELNSLCISEDKMKLDALREETKQAETKESVCEQHEKCELPAAGNIDSRSRRRWRSVKKLVIEGSKDWEKSSSYANPGSWGTEKDGVDDAKLISRSFSARERRRQKRLKEIEMERDETLLEHAKFTNSQENQSFPSLYNNDENFSSDDFDLHSSSSAMFTLKTEEDNEFLHMLSTTLTEDSSLTCDEVVAETVSKENSGEVEARVSQLEASLFDIVGEDAAVCVIDLLKLERWEVWDKQQQAIQELLGSVTLKKEKYFHYHSVTVLPEAC
ncbi:uncharacterized protein [Cherax quadricarinatus]|uniref:uncharacterized protein isoform X2 n=1 Tax=Cherax quadricarinatus TaxID=27406 RepID=UPI002378AE5D|nr:uncharacterized protein LOC128694220 isoform X2 [Cherax quadricarinatus]